VVEAGKVVVLNGTSSSGKTSIALAFQELRAARRDCWIVFGIDDFLAKLPGQWVEIDEWRGPYGDDGMRLVRDGDTARFVVGERARRLLTAYRRSIAEVARSGLNVIVDDVMIEHHGWDEWCAALAGLDPIWVGVRCDVEVAARREAARGDRAAGLARGQAATVHRDPVYDLELDTTSQPADELARRLDAYLGEPENRAG
jgi:chloramphenicol 3-O phosphotransferase